MNHAKFKDKSNSKKKLHDINNTDHSNSKILYENIFKMKEKKENVLDAPNFKHFSISNSNLNKK